VGSLVDRIFETIGWPVVDWSAGQKIVYRFRGGVEITPTAVFQRKQIVQTSPNAYGRQEIRGGILFVREANIVVNGRMPKEGDEFIVSGEQYNVIEVESHTETGFRITGQFLRQTETSGGGHRRRDGG
jgi:hypothetical protein